MNNDDREKAKAIFVNAIKLPPELRLSYLGEVCGDDAALRREVQSLLASHEATDFLIRRRSARSSLKSTGRESPANALGIIKSWKHESGALTL